MEAQDIVSIVAATIAGCSMLCALFGVFRNGRADISKESARLERIDSNVDFIKSRIEKMEKDYDRLEVRVGKLENRASHLEEQVQVPVRRLDRLEERLGVGE